MNFICSIAVYCSAMLYWRQSTIILLNENGDKFHVWPSCPVLSFPLLSSPLFSSPLLYHINSFLSLRKFILSWSALLSSMKYAHSYKIRAFLWNMYILMKYVHSYEICTFLPNMCIVMNYVHYYEICTFLPNVCIPMKYVQQKNLLCNWSQFMKQLIY